MYVHFMTFVVDYHRGVIMYVGWTMIVVDSNVLLTNLLVCQLWSYICWSFWTPFVNCYIIYMYVICDV